MEATKWADHLRSHAVARCPCPCLENEATFISHPSTQCINSWQAEKEIHSPSTSITSLLFTECKHQQSRNFALADHHFSNLHGTKNTKWLENSMYYQQANTINSPTQYQPLSTSSKQEIQIKIKNHKYKFSHSWDLSSRTQSNQFTLRQVLHQCTSSHNFELPTQRNWIKTASDTSFNSLQETTTH